MGCDHEAHLECDHCEDASLAPSLLPYIDLGRVTCLNERVPGSGRSVLKPAHLRHDRSMCVESECDDQLLLHIPFTGSMKLLTLCLAGGPEAEMPTEVRLFANRPDLDFAAAESLAQTQAMALSRDTSSMLSFPLKASKFSSVHHLSLFFPSSFGGQMSRLYHVSLHGTYTQLSKDPIISVYELTPNLADHPDIKEPTKPSRSVF